MSVRYFDPEERIREKQIAREQDERDLREGRLSADELQQRNSFVRGLDIKNARLVIRNHMR